MANLDEPGWREDKQRAWLWTVVTAGLTGFVIDRSRGGAVVGVAGLPVCWGRGFGPLVGG